MIVAPTQNAKRAVLRAVLEAVAQFTPVTAALARLYQTTHPTQFENELSEWRAQLSANANELELRIQELEKKFAPILQISDLALEVAIWLVKTSKNGLAEPIDFDEVTTEFSSIAQRDLQEAIFELEGIGLVETEGAIGRQILDVCRRFDIYWLLDPVVQSTSPQNDAAIIAKAIVDEDYARVAELEQRLGWTKRRLNPALALVVGLLEPAMVSREVQPDYVTSGFHVTPRERVPLRRLAKLAP